MIRFGVGIVACSKIYSANCYLQILNAPAAECHGHCAAIPNEKRLHKYLIQFIFNEVPKKNKAL